MLISLIHYLYVFLKNTLTVPKIKDLVNKPIRDYNDMFDIIAKDRGIGMGQNSMGPQGMGQNMNMGQNSMNMGQNSMGMNMDQNSMGQQGMNMDQQGMGQQSMHLELKQFLNDLKSKT